MYINVAQLLKESVGSTRSYRIDETIDLHGIKHVKGTIKLIRTKFCILATGTIHAEIIDICSRCLCQFSYMLDFTLEDEFYPLIDMYSGLPITNNGDCSTIDKNHIIDMDESILQHAQIAKPMKTICQPDCAGICHICGHNLNQGPCLCSQNIHVKC